jgi:hypothetical protein
MSALRKDPERLVEMMECPVQVLDTRSLVSQQIEGCQVILQGRPLYGKGLMGKHFRRLLGMPDRFVQICVKIARVTFCQVPREVQVQAGPDQFVVAATDHGKGLPAKPDALVGLLVAGRRDVESAQDGNEFRRRRGPEVQLGKRRVDAQVTAAFEEEAGVPHLIHLLLCHVGGMSAVA